MITYCIFSVIFAILASAFGKLTPYDPSGIAPAFSGGNSTAASCVNSKPAVSTSLSLHAYLELCMAEEKEVKQRINDIKLSLEPSQSKLQEAVKFEKYDDAAVLKSKIQEMKNELIRLEEAIVTAERIIKEVKVQMIRDEVGALEPADVLREKSKIIYKENVFKLLEAWKPLLEQATVVMHYIMGKAVAAGAREVRVGHFISYDGFKKVAIKEGATSKQKLIVLAGRLTTAFKDAISGGAVKLTMNAGEDFDDEILLETGVKNYFGGGVFHSGYLDGGHFMKQTMSAFNTRQIDQGNYVIGLTESTHSMVVVAELMRTAEPGWLGSRRCTYMMSCLRLRPTKLNQYLESLNAKLFNLHDIVTVDKLVSEYKDIFELYVEFDGLLVKGYDVATLQNIFLSGEELAALHQLLCNPDLSNALIYGFQEKGYNVVMPKNIKVLTEHADEYVENDVLQKFEEYRTFNFPTEYRSRKAELRFFEVYKNYVLHLLYDPITIIDSTLLWDIWNDFPLPSTPNIDWLKNRIPSISGKYTG